VEWSDDPNSFVIKALSPAHVSRVSIIDEEQRIMEVVVEDKQLSLAIGKKGQNVRLAAKLVGWRIDIKSEEEKRQEVEAEMARMERIVEELRSLDHVGDKTIQKLIDAGVGGLAHILEMTDEEVCQIEGIGPKTAEKIRQAATEAKVIWDARDAEEAARFEAERLAAEQAAAEEETRRLAEEQAAAEEAAAAEAAAAAEGEPAAGEEPGPGEEPSEDEAAASVAGPETGGETEAEGEAVAPVAAGNGSSEGGEPDAER
jgi:N utilization substance protein A